MRAFAVVTLVVALVAPTYVLWSKGLNDAADVATLVSVPLAVLSVLAASLSRSSSSVKEKSSLGNPSLNTSPRSAGTENRLPSGPQVRAYSKASAGRTWFLERARHSMKLGPDGPYGRFRFSASNMGVYPAADPADRGYYAWIEGSGNDTEIVVSCLGQDAEAFRIIDFPRYQWTELLGYDERVRPLEVRVEDNYVVLGRWTPKISRG